MRAVPRCADELAQQNVGDGAHMQNVRAGFEVARLDDVAQNVDDGAVRLLVLVNLLFGQVDKVLLARVERECVAHAPLRDRQSIPSCKLILLMRVN